jgi:flagellar hook assembly protein FlgD
VTLRVYNVLGQLVRTLVNTTQEAGSYEAVWDGRNIDGGHVSSGVYLYRLEATSVTGESYVSMKKMVLMK